MTRSLALVMVLLVVAGSVGVGTVSADDQSVNDGETFTVETGQIHLDKDGRICAEKQAPDVNKVTIHNAELENVTLYHDNSEDNDLRIEIESARVDTMVLWTNGENAKVNLLAATGGCIKMDQRSTTVLEAYRQEAETFEAQNQEIITGAGAADGAPEPGGLNVGDLLNGSSADNSSDSPQLPGGVIESDTSVDETANDTVGGAVNDTVDETTDTVDNTTDGTVDDTTATVNDTVENTTGDTTDVVDSTTDNTTETVNETTDDTTDAVDNTTDGATEPVTDPVDNTTDETTDTVDETTDAVDNTTDGTTDTVDETTDGTTEPVTTTVDDTTDDTTDTVDDTTDGTTDTVEETATETTETDDDTITETTDVVNTTVDDTTTTVENTTDSTVDSVDGTTTETETATPTDDGSSDGGLLSIQLGIDPALRVLG